MRPAPHAGTTVRSGRLGACLRVLVLLLVLVVPGTHVTAQAVPVAPVSGAGGTAAEYDHLDTALRTPGRSGRRAVVVRPVPPFRTAGRRRTPLRIDARTDSAAAPSRGPRSVVLRC
ncbi:hypothetical protein ACI3K5_20515 [Streptomyces sp. MPA0124]|uniref:hypothetical protein n=1 Tax=unclassified Streptomyces TaxID=2593676 RepID=UPI0007763821|nr:hypothetical protein [Streptomyces sp. CCM_MD2014]MYS49171.1 hypothetical protein [Streptomyces sp. SID6013]